MQLNLVKSLYNVNKEAVTDGVWIDIADGIKWKIAKKDNINFRNAVLKIIKNKGYTQYQVSNGKIPSDAWVDVGILATAETILLDWEGVIDTETGKPVKYTPQIGYDLMKENEGFLEDVQQLSADLSIFQNKVESDEIEKQ
jgi:hypothetical protein